MDCFIKNNIVYSSLCSVHFTVESCRTSLLANILFLLKSPPPLPHSKIFSTPASIVDVWLFLTPLRMLGAWRPTCLHAAHYNPCVKNIQLQACKERCEGEGNMKQKMFLYRAFIAFNLQMFWWDFLLCVLLSVGVSWESSPHRLFLSPLLFLAFLTYSSSLFTFFKKK